MSDELWVPFIGAEGHVRDLSWLQGEFVAHSLQFMIDLLPTIRKLIKGWPRRKILEVLDIGTGSGAGTNLLASLHKSNIFGVQMRVDALDISNIYKRYSVQHFKNINYIIGDLLELEKDHTWDLVLCSATVEHVKPDRLPHFIEELQRRARHWVVIYTSYEEQQLLKGHFVSFNKELIDSFEPQSVEITESIAWKHPRDKVSKVVIFKLKGKAEACTPTIEEEVKIEEIRKQLIQNGDYENAMLGLTPLLTKIPANGRLNYLIRFCLHNSNNQFDKAIAYYDRALQCGFDEFWVRYQRGCLQYNLRNYEAARTDIERASVLNPSHKGAQAILNLLMNTKPTNINPLTHFSQ